MVRSPVDSCFGMSPSQAAKSRPCLKPAPLPIAATTALEMIGPMPGNAHEPLAALVLLGQRFDLGRHGGNAFVQAAPVLDEFANQTGHPWRQRVRFCAQDFRQCFSQRHEALPHSSQAALQ
jgi:hypothetical protein